MSKNTNFPTADKLSIPEATDRESILLVVVVSENIAIVVIQEAVPYVVKKKKKSNSKKNTTHYCGKAKTNFFSERKRVFQR